MSGGKVGTRTMAINGRYIRGFICPDFAAIAKKLGTTTGNTGASSAVQGTAHTVAAGDTLGKIAARYGTTVDALAAINGIQNKKDNLSLMT